jgi:hypothetical protein
MAKTSNTRDKIAQKASIVFGLNIKASNVAAEPCDKRHRQYCIIVYDNNLNELTRSEPAQYAIAFETLLKKLSRQASRS